MTKSQNTKNEQQNDLCITSEQLKEEYEKECKRADELEDSYWKEVEKNKKLKELLKEIRGKIHYINIPKNRHNIFDKYFVDKIDEALQ